MSDVKNQFDEDADARLPAALQREISALYAVQVPVSPELSGRIIAAAHAHLARPNQFRRALRWGGGIAAAVGAIAAIIAIAVYLRPRASQLQPPIARQTPSNSAQPPVVDRRITILEAYKLAKRLESQQPLDLEFDYDHNGRVDRGDVDAIAMKAVELKGGQMQ